jgi:hypothetical protein
LVHHFVVTERVGMLQKPVSKGGFPVIDVRNDAKIAYMFRSCHAFTDLECEKFPSLGKSTM